jgi:hypothetical protein
MNFLFDLNYKNKFGFDSISFNEENLLMAKIVLLNKSKVLNQGILTKGEGSVQLTSSLRQLVL